MAQLTQQQRYEIEVLLTVGFSIIEIGKKIGVNTAVISRELARNSDQRNGAYKADLAQKKCTNRHRLKKKNTRFTNEIKAYVLLLLKRDFSPQQTVGRCKFKNYSCVSAETIYQLIYHTRKLRHNSV